MQPPIVVSEVGIVWLERVLVQVASLTEVPSTLVYYKHDFIPVANLHCTYTTKYGGIMCIGVGATPLNTITPL